MVLALTRLRFSLPYRSARTTALALLEMIAMRKARSENYSIASVPQVPYALSTIVPGYYISTMLAGECMMAKRIKA